MKTSKDNRNLSDQEFDDFFRQQLADYSVKPKTNHWTGSRLWSGLSVLRLSKRVQFAVLTAAALFMLIFGLQFFITQESTPDFKFVEECAKAPAIASAPTDPECLRVEGRDRVTSELKNKSFVLDLEQDQSTLTEDPTVRSEIIDEVVADYLLALLADEDEFHDQVDAAGIAASLNPAKQLPIDEMFEHIPDLPEPKVYTILAPRETQITLPHRFVESEREVEDYLAHYERKQRNKQSY